jgi:hypothetical protein
MILDVNLKPTVPAWYGYHFSVYIEYAATEGGMRRGQVSPAAKLLRNTKTGGTGSKNSPTPQIIC